MFGSVSTVAKPVVSSVNPLLLSSLVYLTASATLAPAAYWRKNHQVIKDDRKIQDFFLVVAIALAGAILAPALYFVGLQQSSASDATLLANGEIIFTVAIALVFFKERLKPLGYLAVLLVLAGVIIVTTDLNFASTLLSRQTYYGGLLILTSTLFWAIDNNISRVATRRMGVARVAHLKGGIGGGTLLVIALFAGIPPVIEEGQIVPILLLGAAGFGGSLYFFLESLKRIGVVRTILLFSLSSVFGLVFAAIFLGERISAYQIIAAAIMLGGTYVVNRKESAAQLPDDRQSG